MRAVPVRLTICDHMDAPWFRRAVVMLALLALVATSCGRFARTGAPVAEPTFDPKDYGSELEFTPPAKAKAGKGRLTIFVLEEGTNRPIEGANVEYKGPSKGTITTNGDGKATTRLKRGIYEVSIPPCGRDIISTTAATARVGVVPGAVAGGQLFTTWEQRYTPTPSVRTSTPAPWKRGKTISLGIRIEDGCDFSAAPGAALRFHAWRVSDNFNVVSQPSLRADGDGFAAIRVACTERGNGEITIYDRLNPDDHINLLTAISAPPDGEPFCS